MTKHIILKTNKVSHHNRKIIAKAGDKCKVIAEHGEVLVVEYNNERFSVNVKDTEECPAQ